MVVAGSGGHVYQGSVEMRLLFNRQGISIGENEVLEMDGGGVTLLIKTFNTTEL